MSIGTNKRYSMKKLIYLMIFILSLYVIGCENKRSETEQTDSLAQYRDTLIGKFNGIDIDTLIAEPIDTTKERAMWDWIIYSKKNSIDTLILAQRFSVIMIQEGDLDRNGTDEFGIRREVEQGTWDSYYIYSYNNRKWQYLINPIWTYSPHFYEELNNGNNVAERTDNPNYIKVRFSDVRNDDFLIIDTLIQVKPQPIR